MNIDKLTTQFQQDLASAQSLANAHNHSVIEPLHVLRSMLQDNTSSVSSLLTNRKVDHAKLTKEIDKQINTILENSLSVYKVDVEKLKELNPDFYVFSAHKLYGPSGLGILYMKDKWLESLGPYQGGGSMIENVNITGTIYAQGNQKFEAGTPPIAQVIGFSAAIDFLKSFLTPFPK